MAGNQYKKSKPVRGESALSRWLRTQPWWGAVRRGFTVEQVPRLVFLVFLAILYIANSHAADRTYRRLAQLQSDVEDLRVDYTTLKADYMYAGKQSEVARRVAHLGLEESVRAPRKIVIERE